MPLPAAAALAPLAGKAATSLGLMGKMKSALAMLKGGGGVAHKAYRALKPVVGRKGARMAGDQIHKMGRGLTSIDGFKKNLGIPMNKQEVAFAVAPDLLFGGMAAATTEGDIVDKAIAGAGSAAGGIVGGLGLRGVLGPKSGLGIMGSEMVGGMLGDQVGYGVANDLIAAKNGGQTPAEQRMMSEQQQYEAQLRNQMYDQFMVENGLG